MSTATYQTVKLTKGKHSSPDQGACAMELVSMLAGEAFSDHPACVCPVIGSLLRSYNDAIDDVRRQDLYDCAALVVGSASSAEVRWRRAARLVEWAERHSERQYERHEIRLRLPGALRRLAVRRKSTTRYAGSHTFRAVPTHTDESHAEVLALIRELVAIGAPDRSPTRPGSDDALELRRWLAFDGAAVRAAHGDAHGATLQAG